MFFTFGTNVDLSSRMSRVDEGQADWDLLTNLSSEGGFEPITDSQMDWADRRVFSFADAYSCRCLLHFVNTNTLNSWGASNFSAETEGEEHWSNVLFVHLLLLQSETGSLSCRPLASPAICTSALPCERRVTQNRSCTLIVRVHSESRLLYLILGLWRSEWWRWLPPFQGY